MTNLYRVLTAIVLLASSAGNSAFSAKTTVSAFKERKVWDGPYEITTIAAPSLQPAYINAGAAAKNMVLIDSSISCGTILSMGTALDINNQYQGWPPREVYIPRIASQYPLSQYPGLDAFVTKSPSASCPDGKVSKSVFDTVLVHLSYTDYDTDKTTFSSSRAAFATSGCNIEIETAYLYWFGQRPKTGDKPVTLAVPTASYSGSGDVARVNTSTFKTVQFKAPGDAAYSSVNADVLYDAGPEDFYICIADVTDKLRGKGKGDIWVGNVQSYLGRSSGGSYAGWTLVLVYSTPSSAPRRISLWDGAVSIEDDSETITLTGLQTPAADNFKSYVGFACLDGENLGSRVTKPEDLIFQTNKGGAKIAINPFAQMPYPVYRPSGYPSSASGADLKDACSFPLFAGQKTTYDGISSSHITSYNEATGLNGQPIDRTPSCINTIGMDVHHLLLPNHSIATGASEAYLTFDAGEQGGTSPFMAYIAVETLQPKLEVSKEATVSKTALDQPLQYTITVANTGGLPSLGGADDMIVDTLDSGVDYIPGSCSIAGASLIGSSPAILHIPLPAIAVDDTLRISFQVKVKDITHTDIWELECKRDILNIAWGKYRVPDGRIFSSMSNASDCAFGAASKVHIVDPLLGADNKTILGPFDPTKFSGLNISASIKELIELQGISPSIIDQYALYHRGDFERVHPDSIFGTSYSDTLGFLAIRTAGTAGQCEDIFELHFVPLLSPEFSQDTVHESCFARKDGAVSVTASFGASKADIAYDLYEGNYASVSLLFPGALLQSQSMSETLSFTVDALAPGEYTILATDAKNKQYLLHYTILGASSLVPSVTAEDVCTGEKTMLRVQSIGGHTPPESLNYSWYSSSDGFEWTKQTWTSISAETVIDRTSDFKLVVSNTHCADSTTVKAKALPVPQLVFAGDTAACIGKQAQFTISGADTYIWEDGTTDASRTLAPQADVELSVTGTIGTCSSVLTRTIYANALPTIVPSNDTVICFGGAATISIKGNADTYAWGNALGTALIHTVSPAVTTEYSVVGTLSGCTSSASVTVQVNPKIIMSPNADTSICQDDSVMLIAAGNATFAWDNGLGAGGIHLVRPAATTKYIVTGDYNGCKVSDSVTISILPRPTVVASASPSAVCTGDETLLSATGALHYQWSNDSTQDHWLSPITTQEYQVTGTDALGCSSVAKVSIDVVQSPTVTASEDIVICFGDAATISVSGNADKWLWDNGLPTGAAQTVSPSISTMYRVTGMLGGCSSKDSVLVKVNPQIIISPGADTAICAGDSVHISAEGNAVSYQWDNGLSPNAQQTVAPASTTRYGLTATFNGCTLIDDILISVHPKPSASASASPADICLGGDAVLSATGGDTYIWNMGTGQSLRLKPETSTSYWVTAYNVWGCSDTASVAVTVHDLPQPHLQTSTGAVHSCEGDPFMLSAGSFASYAWSNGSTDPTIDQIPVGTQLISLTVTNSEGCTQTDTLTVRVNPYPIADLGNDTLLCANMTWEKTVSQPGATYLWNSGSTLPYTSIGTPGGTVWVEVSAGGCTSRDTATVRFTSLPDFTILGDTVIYRGDTAWFKVSKTYPEYLWSTMLKSQTMTDIPNIHAPGSVDYWVMVTDEYSCQKADTVVLHVIEPLQLSIADQTFCAGEQRTLTANAGFDRYSWSTGASSRQLKVALPGEYIISATVLFPPLLVIDTVKVTVLDRPTFYLGLDTSVCDGQTVVMGANVSGKYTWSTGQSSRSISVSSSGQYSLTVSTVEGCSASDARTIEVKPQSPRLADQDVHYCIGSGEVYFTAGGKNQIWYQGGRSIASGTLPFAATDTSTSEYQVTQSSNGCTSPASLFTVRAVHADTGFAILGDTALCVPGIRLQYTTTMPEHEVYWSSSKGLVLYSDLGMSNRTISTDIQQPLIDSIYAEATDRHGCTLSDTMVIYSSEYPVADFSYHVFAGQDGAGFTNNSTFNPIPPSWRSTDKSYWHFGRDQDSTLVRADGDTSATYGYGYYDVKLVAVNAFGCADSVTKEIYINDKPRLYIPSALCPAHKSQQIQMFLPKGNDLSEYKIWIYDGWGNTVWYSQALTPDGQPAEGWDGKAKGGMLAAGVYIWKVEASFLDGTHYNQIGNLNLLR